MQKASLLGLIALTCATMPAQAQLMESSAVRGFAAGLGGGAAAIQTNNSRAMAKAPRMAPEQLTGLVTTYTNQGKAYEKGGKELLAEKSYRDALRMIAQRDGVGSTASVPVLSLLVSSLKAQKNYSEAISNQKTVVLFAKKNVSMAPMEVASAQQELADLYVANHDAKNAELVLKENLAFAKSNSDIPSETRESCEKSLSKLTTEQSGPSSP